MPFFVVFIILSLFLSTADCGQFAESLQVHGFGSQTYTLSSNNNFFGKSTGNGSFEFTEVGINSSIRPFPELQVSAQLLSRRAGKSDRGEPRLDYALADFSFVSGEYLRTGVRLGVVKVPLGFYNETRDIPFTRPGIFLPQSIYFDRTRNLALSANGMQLYGEFRKPFGNLFLQLAIGNPRIGDSGTEVAIFGGEQAGSLDARVSFAGRMLYELYGGRIRFSATATQMNTDYAPEKQDPLLSGEFRFNSVIFSLQYNGESLSLTSEYALRSFRFRNFGSSLPNRSFTGESYYIQGEYRVWKNWGLMLRYDLLFQDKDDKNGDKFSSEFNLPGHSRFAEDITAGLRWDITSFIRLRAEYHNVNGTAWLTTLDNTDMTKTRRFWDLFSILASYRF